MNRELLEKVVREVLMEKFADSGKQTIKKGVASLDLSTYSVREEDRLDTGNSGDQVYCRNLLNLEESPRLGFGLMEMTDTDFEWLLEYDEIDHVISGELTVMVDGEKVTAKPGEVIYIPKGTKVIFSVKGHARFTYVTYPADWENQ